MNEQARKTMMQVVFLVVLMALLAFMVIRMLGAMQKSSGRSSKAAAARSKQDRPTSTNMPVVPRSGEKPSEATQLVASDLHINPDQFRVFALNPPRNPFVQKEEWYNDQLQQIPGYPQLKESDYFEQEEAYLPNVPELFE